MALYHEMPKESIMTVLREQFTPEELDAARLEVNELLLTCNSMSELHNKLFELLKIKKSLDDYKKIHEANFISS